MALMEIGLRHNLKLSEKKREDKVIWKKCSK
jgi:hypothetical protein